MMFICASCYYKLVCVCEKEREIERERERERERGERAIEKMVGEGGGENGWTVY